MPARAPFVLLLVSVASAIPFVARDGVEAGLDKRQASPSPLDSYNGWTREGCWTDIVDSRQLEHYEATVGGTQGMTIERCLDACHADGYGMAGLEYGQECYCGDAITRFGDTVDCSLANMPCTGNPQESCGGSLVLDVYLYEDTRPTSEGTLGVYGDYTAVACFTDSRDARVLPQQMFLSSPMTAELCITACSQAEYEFAGVEYGQECYCGRTLPTTPSAPIRTSFQFGCNMGCEGLTSTWCGGEDRIMVYQSDNPSTMPDNVSSYNDWSYTGCFVDSVSNRVLPVQTATSQDSVMTVEICLDACASQGYTYAGLEYSQECYCGASLPSVEATDGRCSMVCNGNSVEFCGGAAGLSVYNQATVSPVTTTTTATTTSATTTTFFAPSISVSVT